MWSVKQNLWNVPTTPLPLFAGRGEGRKAEPRWQLLECACVCHLYGHFPPPCYLFWSDTFFLALLCTFLKRTDQTVFQLYNHPPSKNIFLPLLNPAIHCVGTGCCTARAIIHIKILRLSGNPRRVSVGQRAALAIINTLTNALSGQSAGPKMHQSCLFFGMASSTLWKSGFYAWLILFFWKGPASISCVQVGNIRNVYTLQLL